MKKVVGETQSPIVRCRVCKRDLVRNHGTWVHAEIQTPHNGHLADPSPADLRKFRDWVRRWVG